MRFDRGTRPAIQSRIAERSVGTWGRRVEWKVVEEREAIRVCWRVEICVLVRWYDGVSEDDSRTKLDKRSSR